MMRRAWLLPLGVCLFLTGCPYDSPVPLGDAKNGTVEARLTGLWTILSQEPGYSEVDIRAFDDRQYLVEMRTYEPHKPADVHRYRAYSSKAGGRMFLNLSELGEKTGGRWTFAAYEFKDADTVAIAMLGDGLVKQLKEPPADSKALRRFVEEHAKDADLLEAGMTLRRQVQ